MTIYNGKWGSFNVFWKGLLISSFPLHKPNKDAARYIYQGDYLLLQVLRDPKHKNTKIYEHIKVLTHFCNQIYRRKLNKLPIRRSDHELFLSSVMALEKLKIIDSKDDTQNGYFIMPKKKKK
jgi:hypothetical protein